MKIDKNKSNYDYPENRKISEKLEDGCGNLIAGLTGFSNAYVSQVLNGKRNNKAIVSAAKDVYKLQQLIIEVYKVKSNK